MRTFIAVPVSPSRELRGVLRRLSLMGHAIRPSNADQMHITVKFLGATDESRVPELARVLTAVCVDLPTSSITLQGLGVFPDRRRPAVLWAGVRDAEWLDELESSLSSQLEPLGFARERRAFHPHLTLARVKARPPQEFFDLIDEHSIDAAGGGTPWGTSAIDRFVLYKSELARDGSKYTPLSTAVLNE